MSIIYAAHAWAYNQAGLLTIPTNGKKPLVRWKGLVNNCSDNQIHKWVKLYPNANIAILTGKANNLTVLDCDDPSISILELEKEFGESKLIVKTPRGGHHLYYRYAGEKKLYKR